MAIASLGRIFQKSRLQQDAHLNHAKMKGCYDFVNSLYRFEQRR